MTESRWIWLWWLGQWYLIEPEYREFYLPLWPGYMRGRNNPKVVLTFGGKCAIIAGELSADASGQIVRSQSETAPVVGAGKSCLAYY